MTPPYTVAILGAGPQGLCALKNILEESEDGNFFTPTLFEARACVGGLWAYDDDPDVTSVLQSTQGNVSRYRNCYGDFPVQDSDFEGDEIGQQEGIGVYLGQKGSLRYLERYVQTFGLMKWIKFGRRVDGMRRVEELGKWEIIMTLRDSRGNSGCVERHLFDKVVVATGQYSVPFVPSIDGLEKFAGNVLHSKKYKRASDFAGKRVMVVGFGNTAADIATDLVTHAKKVYMSHRRGNYIFPRIVNGKPLDLFSNRFKNNIKDTISSIAPVWAQALTNKMVTKMSDDALALKPEWGFRPVRSILVTYPMITDTLVGHLERGSIELTSGIRRISSNKTVQLQDDAELEIDVLILCTGYLADTSLMPAVDFEGDMDLQQETAAAPAEDVIPRLYQNIFSPKHADSLVFLNNWKLGSGICEVADLISMAVAQIWKGNFPLPSQEQMNREIDMQRDWCRLVTGLAIPSPKLVDEGKWRAWLNAAAGTSVNENLGYGLQGWSFWLRDRQLCNMLMRGIDSPHFSRLFDGRRKKWSEARRAIENANRDVKIKFGGHDVKPKEQ